MDITTVKNHYFKQGQGLISGIDLKGVQEKIHFINCDFHPNTWDIVYIDCIFENCEVETYLTKATNCQYLGSYS